jgi:hypothetical protein
MGNDSSNARSTASRPPTMTITREAGCGCPAGGPCGASCTCKARARAQGTMHEMRIADAAMYVRAPPQPASGDDPASCVCKVAKKPECSCAVGAPCVSGCSCEENACLCKAPPEVLKPAATA